MTDNCRILNIDILIITESKLDNTIPTNLITIPGYHEPVRRDRVNNGRNGGGVLIYIANNLVFHHKEHLQENNFEHIWVDVRVNDNVFAINALYRPPNESQNEHQIFLETAHNILSNMNSYNAANYKIIASDLNFGNTYCKYPILNPKPLDSEAADLFASFGFQQLIDIPTRVIETTISLIDLFYINNCENVLCHGTLPKIADHDGIIASFNTKSSKQTQKTKMVFDYKNADVVGLTEYFKTYDFENSVFDQPVHSQAEIYSYILKDAFAKFIPCKNVTIRVADMAWCNSYTRLLLRKKNRNYQLFKKSNCDYQNILLQPNVKPEIVTRF